MTLERGVLIAAALSVLLGPGPAVAASQRTFVASTGFDTNPCSITAPCRSFTAAIALTNAGGEVVVLDSAGYGPVTIGKAVAIAAPPGVYAGISVLAGAGVTVSAAPGDVVTLRGLTINAQGGSTGIAFNSGDALYVDSVIVSGFSGPGGVGLSAATGGATSSLFVRNSVLRDNATGLSTATTGGSLALGVDRAAFERNGTGALLQGNLLGSIFGSTFADGGTGIAAGSPGRALRVELRDCTISGNSGAGVAAIVGATTATTLSVVTSVVSGNAIGLQSANTGNSIYSSDNTITHNLTGLSATASGTLVSGTDNRLVGNVTNGAFSSSVPKI